MRPGLALLLHEPAEEQTTSLGRSLIDLAQMADRDGSHKEGAGSFFGFRSGPKSTTNYSNKTQNAQNPLKVYLF